MGDTLIDIGLYLCYIGMIIGALAAFGFPLMYVIKHPANAKTSVMGIGAIGVLFLISYLLSSSELLPKYIQLGITENSSKMIGAGLISLYMMGIGSVAIAVLVEVKGIFRK